jgi:hypothetical protein
MIYSSVGYCKCGHEIWIEYLKSDSGWKPRFSDDNQAELERCPKCGALIIEDRLQSR